MTTNDNHFVRRLAVRFPDLDKDPEQRAYIVSTDDGQMWPFHEGDSIVLGAGPEYKMIGVFELRKREDQHRTSILRPENLREWIQAFWKWYRGK